MRAGRHFLLRGESLRAIIEGIPAGYDIIGPVREKWAVNLAVLDSADDLSLNSRSEESPGRYRLRDENAGPGEARPMNSAKSFTHRARETLYRARLDEDRQWQYRPAAAPKVKQAFFGLHACDIAGMSVMDRTFNKRFRDAQYDRRRQHTIVIGVDCFEPGENCFCSTFNAGPTLTNGFDLGLSRFGDEYLVEIATDMGARIMNDVDLKPAHRDMLELRKKRAASARAGMVRAFDLKQAVKVLNKNYEHPYWFEVSERCLSCANCINVCPTCYCYQILDKSNLALTETARVRQWDACQNLDFAAVHGGNFRPNRADRIRQWVNHKLNWTIEQYGCAGCVGCGRCITWCPTAIDITEPVRRLGGKEIKLVA
ncbi:MAG: 4Fe-4S dicluster domain-containing protein [Actinomycetota bacterium]|nr:4Fe-4S dicluster domain-containing protein [Actinomycetota bacterium]